MKNQQPIHKVEYLIENIIDAQIASCIEEIAALFRKTNE